MAKLVTNKVETISCSDLDALVTETYGRPYCFQQQDGCQGRGQRRVSIPTEGYDFENNTVPEEVNHQEMGVSFKEWLARDPKKNLHGQSNFGLTLWWERNFYPSLDMVLDDLHKKGLVDAGEYSIIIDW
jgi:hypothetical protein